MDLKSHIDKEFTLFFSSLRDGFHVFEYHIDNKFFENFELSEIKRGELSVELCLEKKPDMMIFNFKLNGKVILPCDICIDDIDIEMNFEKFLYVKFGTDLSEESDDLVIIPPYARHYCFKQYLYEIIHLELPMKRVHGVDSNENSLCNKDMLNIYRKMEKNDNSINDIWKDLLKFNES
ncbi:MAG: YceD family protein [Bacteroidales bacterium]|nr:YceD family protein [Bacteroidales bacterium]